MRSIKSRPIHLLTVGMDSTLCGRRDYTGLRWLVDKKGHEPHVSCKQCLKVMQGTTRG